MTLVIRGARIITALRVGDDPLGIVDDGTLVVDDGRVTAVGPRGDISVPAGAKVVEARGALLTPGLVDCHTHPIFAGDRAGEFAMRARGASYLEIAAAGGGIAATLAPTRSANSEELAAGVRARFAYLLQNGTTTVEAKSGYDLTVDGELRLLEVLAAEAKQPGAPRVEPTLLCHLIPRERADDRAEYVQELIQQLLPRVAERSLATSVDVYCDQGAFTLDEATAIWRAAKALGLAVRGHVGQFADLGAAQAVALLGGLSVDHCEQLSEDGIAALARAGTVAVMLPGACVQLRLPVPPVEKLRAAGVPMAVASDLNPGSSFAESLALQLWLATTHFGMTVEEAWLGVTAIAARALGRTDVGSLAPGAHADFVLWDAGSPADVPYRYARNLVREVYLAGKLTVS